MQSILLTISLLFLTAEAQCQTRSSFEESSQTSIEIIDNGWYDAVVSYYNPSTFQKSSYTLSVKVEYDRVTAIDFGNGGSVHAGYNNSGYFYNGGILSMKKDNQGNIVAGTTRVSVVDSNGTRTFDITIE